MKTINIDERHISAIKEMEELMRNAKALAEEAGRQISIRYKAYWVLIREICPESEGKATQVDSDARTITFWEPVEQSE